MVLGVCTILSLQPVLGQIDLPEDPTALDKTLLDPDGIEHLFLGTYNVRFQAPTVWAENSGEQIVTLTFRTPVDVESLDDSDLWVVSRNGYNSSARFIDAVQPDPAVGDGEGEADPALWIDPETGQILPFPGGFVTARYGVAPPSGEAWTEADNGRYVVLLEPDQVIGVHGVAFPPRYLGDFRVGIGEPRPAIPEKAFIEVDRSENGLAAVATIVMPETGWRVAWGELESEGSLLIIPVEIMESTVEPQRRWDQRYDLSELQPGVYRILLRHGETDLARVEVRVDDEKPEEVPAEVTLRLDHTASGQVVVHARIHFIDPFFVLADEGTPKRVENRFVIDAAAERVVFVRPPDEPAITEVEYLLELPGPGEYGVVFRLNGRVYATREFRFPLEDDRRPVIHAFGAEPRVVAPGQETTLFWRVEGADTIEIDRGIGKVDGNSITIVPGATEPQPEPNPDGSNPDPDPGFPNGAGSMLVSAGSTWKYLDDGSNPGPEWISDAFDDSEWAEGPAQLGYGDGDEATEIGFGDDANAKHVTTYFRHTFVVDDAEIGMPLFLSLQRDDGAIVYLNGEPILRNNVPAEAGPETLATSTVGGAGEREWHLADVDPGMLREGGDVNVLAVEVHQASRTSSDVSFDLALSIGEPWVPFEPHFPREVVYTLTARNDFGSDSARTSVVIREEGGEEPRPLRAEIHIVEGDARWFAEVGLDVPDRLAVRHWGELVVDGNVFSAEVTVSEIIDGAGPPVAEPHHRYALGVLKPGPYLFVLHSGGERIAAEDFRVSDGNGGGDRVHTGLRAEPVVKPDPDEAPYVFTVIYESAAGIDLETLGEDDVDVLSWTRFLDVAPLPFWAERRAELVAFEASDDGTRVAARYAIAPPDGGWTAEHNGQFDVRLRAEAVRTLSGQWAVSRMLGSFRVRIDEEPEHRIFAALRSDDITHAGGELHRFQVVYESAAGLDAESLGDNDVEVTSWVVLADFEGEPPLWAVQKARFQEAEVSDDKRRIAAFYSIAAPDGGWAADQNGALTFHLTDTSVRDADGKHAAARRLGDISIAIRGDSERIPAEAVIEVEQGDGAVTASVWVTFDGYFSVVNWGKPRRDGKRFVLDAEAVPIDFIQAPQEPLVEKHRYVLFEAGDEPVADGVRREFGVVFRLNGHAYADAHFVVNPDGTPPPSDDDGIRGEVAVDLDGTAASVRVLLDFSDAGGPWTGVDWGEPALVENRVTIHVGAEPVEVNEESPTPGAPPIFENVYTLDELNPGRYQVDVHVNRRPVAKGFFVIHGSSDFLRWLDSNLRDAADAAAEQGGAMPIHSVDDADGDGIKDFVEWAVGLNAAVRDGHSGVKSHLISQGGKKHLAMSFRRRVNAGEVRYIVEKSSNLHFWIDVTDKITVIETKPAGDGVEQVTVCLENPVDAAAVEFVRLRVEEMR